MIGADARATNLFRNQLQQQQQQQAAANNSNTGGISMSPVTSSGNDNTGPPPAKKLQQGKVGDVQPVNVVQSDPRVSLLS